MSDAGDLSIHERKQLREEFTLTGGLALNQAVFQQNEATLLGYLSRYALRLPRALDQIDRLEKELRAMVLVRGTMMIEPAGVLRKGDQIQELLPELPPDVFGDRRDRGYQRENPPLPKVSPKVWLSKISDEDWWKNPESLESMRERLGNLWAGRNCLGDREVLQETRDECDRLEAAIKELESR